MTKDHLILKYFQKAHLLTVKNPRYCKILSTLFLWMTDTDGVKNDVTTKSLKINKEITAKIICRDENIVLSGMEELGFLIPKFTKLDFIPLRKDKDIISKNQTVAELHGKASEILAYERTILNILQRMSGITTQTSSLITNSLITNKSDRMYLLSKINAVVYIAATRKTPWMWLDKKAVAIGGGLTHRLNLSDGILIKDNHLRLLLKRSDLQRGPTSTGFFEIEVESEKQAYAVIKSHAEQGLASYPLAIMLDNFTPDQAKNTINRLKKQFDLSSVILEASGGIDEKNIPEWSKTGVDIISLGSLTHSAKAANFSLDI